MTRFKNDTFNSVFRGAICVSILLNLFIFGLHWADVKRILRDMGTDNVISSEERSGNDTSAGQTLTINGLNEQVEPFVEKRYDSIFYLKTHKTGSTTVAKLLYHYVRRHNLATVRAPGHLFISKPNTSSRKVDAAVGHHFAFSWEIIMTYLRKKPTLVLTSMRLPLQRRLSWFRQQHRDFESLQCPSVEHDLSNPDTDVAVDERNALLNFEGTAQVLEKFDAFMQSGSLSTSQWQLMTESSSRKSIGTNLSKIIDQFHFIILKERMVESLTCLCKTFNVRLCSNEFPLTQSNVGDSDACVKRILLTFRLKELGMNCDLDSLLYEMVSERLSVCVRSVPEHCRCPVID